METLDFDFLKTADEATLRLEKAKRSLENAKTELENAKLAYEALFSQADQHGFNKAKLKKLTEDRVHALIDSYSIETKTEKIKKSKKSKGTANDGEASNLEFNGNEAQTEELNTLYS